MGLNIFTCPAPKPLLTVILKTSGIFVPSNILITTAINKENLSTDNQCLLLKIVCTCNVMFDFLIYKPLPYFVFHITNITYSLQIPLNYTSLI